MGVVLVAATAAAAVLGSAPAVVSTEDAGSAGTNDTDRRRGPVVVAAAGDISDCRPLDCDATRTASRVLQIDPAVALTLGDNQYESGTYQEFMAQYDRTWGRFKGRTRPAVGNHEYETPGASGYFRYFGRKAGNPNKGYYSFNEERWHLVALNTGRLCRPVRCGPDSAQVRWLRRDLRQDDRKCVLAYWHHPPWSTGYHGNNSRVRTLWQTLARRGADVVLNGHDHSYERFARRGAGGGAARNGVRQFVVGTGGRALYGFESPPDRLTQKRIGNRHGVLELLLRQNAYGWRFRSAAGPVLDSGGPVSCD